MSAYPFVGPKFKTMSSKDKAGMLIPRMWLLVISISVGNAMHKDNLEGREADGKNDKTYNRK